MVYINKQSWFGLLGKNSKDVQTNKNVHSWIGNRGRRYVVISGEFSYDDLVKYIPFSFLYFSKEVIDQLSVMGFEVEASRQRGVISNLSNWDNGLYGRAWRDIRYCLNKNDYILTDEYPGDEKMNEMISKWSNSSLAEKYFQDHSSKTKFFYNSRYHDGCINKYCYDNDKLIGFGTLSIAEEKKASYICGKALCNEYVGLSEYIDYKLLMEGKALGIEEVDWGQSDKGVLKYKMKFPGSYVVFHYNGKVSFKK